MDFNLGQELIRILKEGGRTFEATRDMADGLVESTAQLPKGAAFTKPNTAPRITKAGSKMLLEMMQKRAAHAVVMSLQMCCTLEEIAQRTESPEYQIFGQMTFQDTTTLPKFTEKFRELSASTIYQGQRVLIESDRFAEACTKAVNNQHRVFNSQTLSVNASS